MTDKCGMHKRRDGRFGCLECNASVEPGEPVNCFRKAALNVVSMPVRNLQDVPALLRNKADEIERGEMGDVRTCFVVFPRTDDYPRVFGWGDIDGTRDPAIQLQLAVQWLLANLTKRN